MLKKRSLNRPLGCHGEPRGAPGSQNEAKIDAKRLPKEVQKHRFFRIGWKTEKCNKNTLFARFQPHRPHQQMTIFGNFSAPKMMSKPRGDQMRQKCRQRVSPKPPERVQSPKLVATGCQMRCQGGSQNDPKIAFWGVLGHRCDAKGLQGVSGHPPKLKMEPKWHRNRSKTNQKSKS